MVITWQQVNPNNLRIYKLNKKTKMHKERSILLKAHMPSSFQSWLQEGIDQYVRFLSAFSHCCGPVRFLHCCVFTSD